MALAGAGALASAQSFVNPNFSGNATGWNLIDCDFGGYQNSPGQGGQPGWVWLNSNGTSTTPRAEQTVSGFTVGKTYTVGGCIRTIVNFISGDVFQATVDGVKVLDGPNKRLDEWTLFKFDFTATSTSHKFGFLAEVTSDTDWGLDTMYIIPAVPEPGTWLVMGAGAAMLLRRRARRR